MTGPNTAELVEVISVQKPGERHLVLVGYDNWIWARYDSDQAAWLEEVHGMKIIPHLAVVFDK